MDAAALIRQGDQLFEKRGTLLSMWQEIADNFYPERADFTVSRNIGDSFADNLTTSYPILVRRDLCNSFSPLMRPVSLDWFHMRAEREEVEDQPALAWMEWASGTMRRAMYDRKSQFLRASKEGDHDLGTFGQCVKSVELNGSAERLLYRCWHLRDCAWCEDENGQIDTLHRKWKPTADMLRRLFRDKIHSSVKDMIVGGGANPYREVNCRHIVMPADQFDGDYLGKGRKNIRFVSIYLDADNKHIMEAVGQTYFMYVVPRWQTVSGSQYAYSPSTVAALPDARLIQAMTLTLLEAGEKATNPPMVAVQEAIRSDIAVYAGGVTWVDQEYDERLGEVLRPLTQDKSGIPLGMDMRRDIASTISEAFYLNKLSPLPPMGSQEITAYEAAQRVQDYIRQASPLFEPLEHEDNGAVCETTFELMMNAGAFGSLDDVPQSLRGQDITFRFESPLHDAIERQKGQKFMEARALTAESVGLYPSAATNLDFKTAFRDTLLSIGVPAKWVKSEAAADEEAKAEQEAQQTAQLLQTMQAGGQVAEQIGKAGQALGGQPVPAGATMAAPAL